MGTSCQFVARSADIIEEWLLMMLEKLMRILLVSGIIISMVVNHEIVDGIQKSA